MPSRTKVSIINHHEPCGIPSPPWGFSTDTERGALRPLLPKAASGGCLDSGEGWGFGGCLALAC